MLSWNVRGLGNSRTFCDLKNLHQDKKPDIVCLTETLRLLSKWVVYSEGLVWEASCVFLVKGYLGVSVFFGSGYWAALELQSQTASLSSSSSSQKLWKHLWKLKLSPKMQHFLWRLGHNAIPTREVL
ncbi:hypothetical protein L3X38_038350 [Prunus dulcis]|uniref:Reverse transcriptase zinc-binding domain-containing protein n=1 Tax=Prunus dulcis TaxID=3755 RepID=A0AAD4V6P9_PRUDU|nr:hypothetical protein L3X38_038350 [Prunus dulcis]